MCQCYWLEWAGRPGRRTPSHAAQAHIHTHDLSFEHKHTLSVKSLSLSLYTHTCTKFESEEEKWRGECSEVLATAGQARQAHVLAAVGTRGVGPLHQIVTVEEQLREEGGAGGGEVTEASLGDVWQA